MGKLVGPLCDRCWREAMASPQQPVDRLVLDPQAPRWLLTLVARSTGDEVAQRVARRRLAAGRRVPADLEVEMAPAWGLYRARRPVRRGRLLALAVSAAVAAVSVVGVMRWERGTPESPTSSAPSTTAGAASSSTSVATTTSTTSTSSTTTTSTTSTTVPAPTSVPVVVVTTIAPTPGTTRPPTATTQPPAPVTTSPPPVSASTKSFTFSVTDAQCFEPCSVTVSAPGASRVVVFGPSGQAGSGTTSASGSGGYGTWRAEITAPAGGFGWTWWAN